MIHRQTQLPDVSMDLHVEIEFVKEPFALVKTALELVSFVDQMQLWDCNVMVISVFQRIPNSLEKDAMSIKFASPVSVKMEDV
jgi:hypothetical protein